MQSESGHELGLAGTWPFRRRSCVDCCWRSLAFFAWPRDVRLACPGVSCLDPWPVVFAAARACCILPSFVLSLCLLAFGLGYALSPRHSCRRWKRAAAVIVANLQVEILGARHWAGMKILCGTAVASRTSRVVFL